MRIPFTNIEFSATKFILSYLALFGGVNANNNKNSNENCLIPQGNFLDSCTMPRMNFYPSSDPLVPGTCKLTTSCNTYYDTPVKGNYYLPMATQFTGVINKNGTLYDGDRVLGKSKKSKDALDCLEGDNLPKLFDEEVCQKPSALKKGSKEWSDSKYKEAEAFLKERKFNDAYKIYKEVSQLSRSDCAGFLDQRHTDVIASANRDMANMERAMATSRTKKIT